MAINQHFDFPFRFTGVGSHALTVEQDSDEDIINCVHAATLTPVGTRFYVPQFGITDPTFSTNRDLLAAELQASDPRAGLTIVEKMIDQLEVDITVGVDSIG